MSRLSLKFSVVLAVISVLAGTSAGATAQATKDYYAGRSINVIVPFDPGGYYDIGARLLARHLGRHIPGRPNVVVQNQPSVGGIGLANRFAAGAEADGTTVGVLQRAIPQYAFIGYQNARFDPMKLSWIGSLSAYETDSYVLVVNASHPVSSLAELKSGAIKTRLGAGRAGSANLIFALVAKDLFSLQFDIVRGYPGTAPIFLALQRVEVDGLMADFSTIKASLANLWSEKKIRAIVQFGRKTRHPDLADVPTARELVQAPEERAFLEFAELPFFMALPLAGPSGIPPERLDALQKGFMAMAEDPAFLNDAKAIHFDVDPISGQAVVKAISEASKTPPAVMDRFSKLVADR